MFIKYQQVFYFLNMNLLTAFSAWIVDASEKAVNKFMFIKYQQVFYKHE